MSIIKAHVTASSCDLTPSDRTPFWEVLPDHVESLGNSDRMAGRPENFTKAGFFYSCRTPHVSTEPEWAARNKTPATLHPRVAPTELRSGIGEVVLSSGETSGTMKVNDRLMAQLVSPGAMRRYGQGYHPLGKGIV